MTSNLGKRALTSLNLKLPFWRYHEAVRDQPYSFLLDSALPDKRIGRWSFLGADPFLIFKATRLPGCLDASIELTDPRSGETTSFVADPFEHLRSLIAE